MIKERYCSFEVAKLLKEKGFNYEVRTYYQFDSETKETELIHDDRLDTPNLWSGDYYSAPTHQMAMDWLREIHNKHCDINYDIDLDWFFQIMDLKETVEYDYPETKYYHTENETGFNTYEDAVESALKYCLTELI